MVITSVFRNQRPIGRSEPGARCQSQKLKPGSDRKQETSVNAESEAKELHSRVRARAVRNRATGFRDWNKAEGRSQEQDGVQVRNLR